LRLRQRLLALLFLLRLDLARLRRDALRFGLRDGGVLQLHLVVEIVERGFRARNAGFGLGDLRLVIRGVDLYQKVAGLDALEILRCDGAHFARDTAGEPCHLGANIGVVGGLHGGSADPGVPAQRRQPDK
jgi:hypothetical protein